MNKLLLFLLLFHLNSCKTGTGMNTAQVSIIDAVKDNQLAFVETQLKNGADVNTKDKKDRSLLLLATHANNLEMAQLLVSYGADVNQQDDIKDSPFLYAGASGYKELVKLFLAN